MHGPTAYVRTYEIPDPEGGRYPLTPDGFHPIPMPFKYPPVLTVWGHNRNGDLTPLPFPGVGPGIEYDKNERVLLIPVVSRDYYPLTVSVSGNGS